FVGTNHGIFSLASLNASWLPAKMLWGPVPEWQPKPAAPEPEPVVSKSKSSKATVASRHKVPVSKPKVPSEPVIPVATAPQVRSLQMGDKAWFAATDEGLFISVDKGQKWYGQSVEGERDFSAVNCYEDGTVAPVSVLWLGTRQGALRSTDGGQSWHYMLGGLPKNDVLAVHYDATGQRLLATALHAHGVFASKDGGQTWQRTPEASVSIRSAMNFQGRLLGASAHNGLLLEQGSVATSESARAAEANSSANRE